MTTSASRADATPSRLLLRMAAFLAGASVMIGAAIVSMGTALLAPIGMWTFSALRRRRGRRATRPETWLAAMSWVAIGLLGLSLVIVDSLPDGSMRQIRQAADSASGASYQKPPPAWVERMAPGTTARTAHGSGTPASLRTPLLIWSAGVALLIMAGVAGSLGWAGSMLCGFAIAGRWPNGPARDHPRDPLTEDAGNAFAT